MKKYLEYKQKNDSVVNGEEIEFNGETHIIGKMTEEEINEMRVEGNELLKTEVTYKGEKIPLSKIKSGKDLYNITEAIELEGGRMVLGVQFHPERMDDIGPGFFELLKSEAEKYRRNI